ncbi:1-phosphofructokinase [Amphibacillus marinus]|uniref:Tagatose-6-phosphate kinase n=1 Tax=Amphibacillus marinus TaxID=872970 RepID=A0A1H8Q5I1_9BACI|nr:1-phosphofructokinase [Amphibacillus marinus]SEO49177.1 1-phosphofructokinase [Amphibacillus marinus]
MIYTCTVNPSLDYILKVEHCRLGALNRGEEPEYFPGGKGINVSRILKRLAIDNTALGFIGGFTGKFIEDALLAEAITTQFIEVNEPTRINMKLKANHETEFNGPGPRISEQQQVQLFKQIQALSPNDILVLAGSLPSSLPTNIYVQFANVCHQLGVKVVVDTSSAALRSLLGTPIFLVKPNQHELGELFNTTINSVEDAIFYGKQLLSNRVEHVIISMGGAGAIYLSQTESFMAQAPQGNVVNTVGAGDSTVAGFLAGYTSGTSTSEAFRYAVAAGSATAFNHDLAEKKDVEALLPLVMVEETDF